MFNVEQLADHVIKPSLKEMGLYSEEAEQLLIGTASVESKLGTYLKQVKGPALGIYQIEPATHHDVWENYIQYRSDLKSSLMEITSVSDWVREDYRPCHSLLIHDLRYATIIARLIYRRVPYFLPTAGDWPAMAEYWKSFYNTSAGKGTVKKFISSVYDCGVVRAYRERGISND